MELWMPWAGPGLCLLGALMVAVGDAWLSRSLLIYLDAIEANVRAVIDLLRSGGTHLDVTGIDVKRDRGQNLARTLKSFGWVLLVLGFAVQFAHLVALPG